MQVLHLRAATLGGHDPYERVGDDLGPDVVRDQERDDLPREDVAVSVDITLELDLTYESGARATPRRKLRNPGPVIATSATPSLRVRWARRISATCRADRPAGRANCNAMFVA